MILYRCDSCMKVFPSESITKNVTVWINTLYAPCVEVKYDLCDKCLSKLADHNNKFFGKVKIISEH